MSVVIIEEHHCDRCKEKYEERREGFADTVTMAIGWFEFHNGNGSKKSTPPSRSWENLDYDMCPTCTREFRTWWATPPERN